MTSEINRMTRNELLEHIRQMEDDHRTEVWNLTREKAKLLLSRNKMEKNWSKEEKNNLLHENTLLHTSVAEKDQVIAEYEKNNNDIKQRLREKERDLDEALRILRERANVERNLRPKTSKSGYVILSYEEWTEKIYDDDLEMLVTYRTILQTYYDNGFDLAVIRDLVKEDLIRKILPMMKLQKNVLIDNDYRADPNILITDKNGTENLIYKLQLKYNANKGYYEVTIYHTMPVGTIPEDLLPPEKESK